VPATPPVDRLHQHLRTWLGRWPAQHPVDVVGSDARERPGWDGRVFPVIGVRTPEAGVLSVPPPVADAVRAAVAGCPAIDPGWAELAGRLPDLIGAPDKQVYSGVFRWCERPTDLPDAGVWIDVTDPVVPEWLTPFGSPVLIARDPDTGAYLAGVGIKHHDPYGREIAVGTEPAARGRGLARALVAQAARRVLDEGAVPTYQHDPANIASARVAAAAGFPDLGWRSLGLA
jgi:GNAT superfamily N-acetyltransferase